MSEQKNIRSGFLKEKLGNYQVNPPDKVWDEISGQMGNGRKRRGMYILLMATAASIALAITLGIHFFGPDMPRQQSLVDEVVVEEEAAGNETPRTQEEQTGELPGISGDSDKVREVPGEVRQALAGTPVDTEGIKSSELLAVDTEALEKRELEGPAESGGIAELVPAADLDYAPDLDYTRELLGVPEPVSTLEKLIASEPAGDRVAQVQPDTSASMITNPYAIVEQEKKKDPRWMLGAAISPLYSYRDAEDVALTSSPAESGLLSYSTGVHVSYRRNSRLAFETGIYYNRTGIAIGAPGIKVFSQRNDAMIFGPGSEMADITSVSNSVGNIVAYSGDIFVNGYMVSAENGTNDLSGDVLQEVKTSGSGIQQHLDFLELPFNLRYSVIDRTIELQLVGGMSTNFLVGNSVTMKGSSGREEIGYLSNVNTVNYSGNAGLGMIYHMGSKLNLILEPRFRYFINSVNDATLPSTRPYSLGFYTGLSYTF